MENNRTAQEPSGIRLMRLIDTQLVQIIRKERTNETHICLYGTGEYWVAFERSAYLLCQLFPASDVSIATHPENPFPVVMAGISDAELRVYGRQHIFRRDLPDYKELVCSKAPALQYPAWHRREVQKFDEGISAVHQRLSGC